MTPRDLPQSPAGQPRIAHQADAERITALLVDAFAHDPMWGAWAFPRRLRRRGHRAAVFQLLVAGALRYPWTWVAPGNAAVAMWIPAGGTDLSARQEAALESVLRTRLGQVHASRVLTAFEMFESMTPREPHYYLSLLGADPAHAGHGHAQTLLAHNLELLDAQNASAYLDCSDGLVALYSRFGFRRISSIVLPDGPRSNGMWRTPRSGHGQGRGDDERTACSCRRR